MCFHVSLLTHIWVYRSANELDKKEHAQNFEHGQAMEKNLITMAREVEKLRAEMANAEKRARASAAVGNAGLSLYQALDYLTKKLSQTQ